MLSFSLVFIFFPDIRNSLFQNIIFNLYSLYSITYSMFCCHFQVVRYNFVFNENLLTKIYTFYSFKYRYFVNNNTMYNVNAFYSGQRNFCVLVSYWVYLIKIDSTNKLETRKHHHFEKERKKNSSNSIK